MAYILHRMYEQYLKIWESKGIFTNKPAIKLILYVLKRIIFQRTDNRLNHLPFMSSPLPIVIVISAYLYFIRNGKSIMEHRKPFKIERIIIAYNIIQIIANSVIFLVVSSSTYINFECDATIFVWINIMCVCTRSLSCVCAFLFLDSEFNNVFLFTILYTHR